MVPAVAKGWQVPRAGRVRLSGLAKTRDPLPLYVRRDLLNAEALVSWAKGAGFATTIPAEEMHVTILYSRSPVDWMAMGSDWSGDEKGHVTVPAGGPRQLERFGPNRDAVVLRFVSDQFEWRHNRMVEAGASHDFQGYHPHVTISWDAPGIDENTLEAFQGELVFGPEIFETINEDWKAGLVEKHAPFRTYCKVAAVDKGLGLVFGWAIVCTDGGAPYWDVQKNHIPDGAMLEATTEFMKGPRVNGDMHVRGTTPEMAAGQIVHSFPLTADIAKAMGITCRKTGWMIAAAPDAAQLAKFDSGEYTGFSIGGDYLEIDGKPVLAEAA